ncbi:hypothetical protein IV454_27935 [Massilia antarctica]|uniref:Uncharacterized protein n=1 Tax=Massilia antarctica TaxID=2765360 RepID=A0AA48WDH0_9BURK|nr:hypothetical protein [Massilia antarctica]QPI49240.1 hypothetical protein IV454_27935 [Massilia antarctica]
MNKLAMSAAFLLTCVGQAASSQAGGVDIQKYIAQQGWTPYEGKSASMPFADLAPVMYVAKGQNAPSCGLLAQGVAGPLFFDILTPEKGESYPQCLSINASASFNLGSKNYVVVEYLDRDTKDETYRYYYYLHKDGSGKYTVDERLNSAGGQRDTISMSALKRRPTDIEEGIKVAKADYIRQSYPSLAFLQRDFISDVGSAFAILKDEKAGRCTFVIDAGSTRATFTQDYFATSAKCADFLASTRLESKGKSFYLGMFAAEDKSRHLAVFSVDKENHIAAEKELALSANNGGKTADMKTARQQLQKALEKM